MRLIADSDLQRLRLARRDLDNESLASAMIDSVLENMARLEKEQPNPDPRVVTLTTDELRRIYPERFIAGEL